MVIDLVDTYGANWTQMAIRQAIGAGALSLKYITKILQNWKAKGGPTTRRKTTVDAAQMAAEMREEGIESW